MSSPKSIDKNIYKNNLYLFISLIFQDNLISFCDYQFIAIDGSEIIVLPNQSNFQLTKGRSKKDSYHHFVHLYATYNVQNKVIIDVVIQTGFQKNEDAALLELVTFASDHSIFIADRGYESRMIFYKINQNKVPFVIRIKNEESSTSILNHYHTPNSDEYDIPFNVILTSKNRSYVK